MSSRGHRPCYSDPEAPPPPWPPPPASTAQDHFCASRIIPLYERYYEAVVATRAPHLLIVLHLRRRILPQPPPGHPAQRLRHPRARVLQSHHHRLRPVIHRLVQNRHQPASPASPGPGGSLISTRRQVRHTAPSCARARCASRSPAPCRTRPLTGATRSTSGPAACPAPSSSTSSSKRPIGRPARLRSVTVPPLIRGSRPCLMLFSISGCSSMLGTSNVPASPPQICFTHPQLLAKPHHLDRQIVVR